jgi:hypothetical protein
VDGLLALGLGTAASSPGLPLRRHRLRPLVLTPDVPPLMWPAIMCPI